MNTGESWQSEKKQYEQTVEQMDLEIIALRKSITTMINILSGVYGKPDLGEAISVGNRGLDSGHRIIGKSI
jgi:hypothetical protein